MCYVRLFEWGTFRRWVQIDFEVGFERWGHFIWWLCYLFFVFLVLVTWKLEAVSFLEAKDSLTWLEMSNIIALYRISVYLRKSEKIFFMGLSLQLHWNVSFFMPFSWSDWGQVVLQNLNQIVNSNIIMLWSQNVIFMTTLKNIRAHNLIVILIIQLLL